MSINQLLAQTGGLQSLARQLGLNEQQAASGVDALLPAIMGGFKNQTQAQPAGPAGLGELFGQLGGGSLLDEVLAPQPADPGHGNAVLGQIFGSKDVSRTVAGNAASQSGLSPELLQKMLPLLAMLVTGLMAKQGGAAQAAPGASMAPGGGLGDLLGGLLGGGQGPRGGGGLGSLLDLNGDGNPLDDILRMAGKALK